MASNNKVCVNIDQTDPEHGGFTDAEKLQARKNTGAAGISSLAPSFESRAPNYKWDAGEVCTYGGALWEFDNDHTGPWTDADAHEVPLLEAVSHLLSTYIDISDKFELDSGFLFDYFIVKYNPVTMLVYSRVQMSRHPDYPALGTGVVNFATPKNDCPIGEIGNIYALRTTPTTYQSDAILSMKNGHFYVYINPNAQDTTTNMVNGQGISMGVLV